MTHEMYFSILMLIIGAVTVVAMFLLGAYGTWNNSPRLIRMSIIGAIVATSGLIIYLTFRQFIA